MAVLAHAAPIAFVLSANRAILVPFYRDVLGLRHLFDDGFADVFDLGGGTVLRLTAVGDHVAQPHTVLGWSVPDIMTAAQLLAAAGVTFNIYPGFGQDALGIWHAPGGTAKVAWFNDPEGNVLSLTQTG